MASLHQPQQLQNAVGNSHSESEDVMQIPNCYSSFKNKTQNILSSCMGKIDNFDIRNPFQQFNDGQQVGKTGDADVGAGHVGKYISLANPDKVSQLSRHFPLAVVFILASLSFIPAAMFTTDIFFLSFVILTGYIALYCFQLVICTLIGANNIRREVKKPWINLWEEHVKQNPDAKEGI